MPSFRSEPYRLFFPLGAILGGFGVSQWLWYALGWQETYSGQGHALTQIQAFLTAFACGFLMTMAPRRTHTPPPTALEMTLAGAGLLLATVAGAWERWLVAETAFLVVLATLVQFAVRRFRSAGAGRRPPNAFVLIPIGLLHGVVGALLIAAAHVGSFGGVGARAIGRGCIQEGLFLCLCIGIGHMILPLLTGYDVPADADGSPAGRRERTVHLLVGCLILASFPLQHVLTQRYGALVGTRAAYGLRWALATYEILFRMRAYRWPRTPGLHRRFVWLSFWLIVVGLALPVIVPVYRVAMLHVLFIGGFGLMTFSVGSHVIVAHGNYPELVTGRPWQVWAFGLLLLLAMTTRVSADFVSYFMHLGAAAAVWLAALLIWVAYLVPKALTGPATTGE